MPTESKSETPRTDAVASTISALSSQTSEQFVLAYFARQLEKELNEAKREIEACYKLVNEAGVSHAIGAENQGVRTLVAWIINERDAITKKLAEANEKLEQKDNEKDEEWLSAIAKAWNFQFNKPYETKDTTEANVCQVFQEIENLIAAHNEHVKEIEEVTEAISKFGYQDGTLVSMCERFKAYCDNQTRHLKEDTTAAGTAVTQLAKENKVMREALEIAQQWIEIDCEDDYCRCHEEAASDGRVSCTYCNESNSVTSTIAKALKGEAATNLIVLTRNELIAEIEKMPCTCEYTSINPETREMHWGGQFLVGNKCRRCRWLAKVKGEA